MIGRAFRHISWLAVMTLAAGSLTLSAPSAMAASTRAKISVGAYAGCAITESRHLKCWGDNPNGELGIGDDLTVHRTPVTVPGLSNVRQVSVGERNTCAVLEGGRLKCWGYNYAGAVGDGTSGEGVDRHVPTQVLGLTSGVKNVDVGAFHVCAVLTDGRIKCWGENSNGEAGDGTFGNLYDSPVFVSKVSKATQVSAGYGTTCATINGGAKCWGLGGDGQIGDTAFVDRHLPTQVTGLTVGVTRVVVGHTSACAIIGAGRLKCWGSSYYGQVGDGTSGESADHGLPTQVTGLTSGVTSVDIDHYFACAVQGGAVKCWGNNEVYELGDGTDVDHYTPAPVTGLGTGVKSVEVGYYTGCALRTTGVVRCWGNSTYGQVGNGSLTVAFPTPVVVAL